MVSAFWKILGMLCAASYLSHTAASAGSITALADYEQMVLSTRELPSTNVIIAFETIVLIFISV